LSYQWYYWNNYNWTPASGVTDPDFSVSFTMAGTFYYYVEVTNTNNNAAGNKTASRISEIATVTAAGPAFVPVSSISGTPLAATVGVPLTLSGTVNPANATNKDITWLVKNTGATGAWINGNTLYAPATGIVTVTAAIANGKADGLAYTQDFDITVSTPEVKDAQPPIITAQPKSGTTQSGQTSYTLSVTAESPDGGYLNYQWFFWSGSSWTPVQGLTEPNLTISFGAAGTYYFYVTVTNTNNNASGNKTATVTSDYAVVFVL
jgi:hypothetical protein